MNTRTIAVAVLALFLLSSVAHAQQRRDRTVTSDIFSWVRGAVQHGSLLHVLDRERAVLVFSIDDGSPRPPLGRAGEGPGEFASLARIGVRGDTIWVYDSRLRRIQFFRDGKYITGVSTGTVSDVVDGLLPDGSLLTSQLEDWHGIGAGLQTSIAFTKRVRDLSAQTPVVSHTVSAVDVIRANPSNDPSQPGGFHSTSPLATNDIVRVSSNGAALFRIDRAMYNVTRIDPITGRTVWTQRYEHQPKPLTSELRQHVTNSVFAGADNPLMRRQYASEAAMRESVEKAIAFPRALPPVTDAVASTDGSLWVRREYSTGLVSTWDVIDPAGKVVRSIQLPVGFKGLSAGPGYIWGTEKTELDVPVVVRYRSN